MEFETLTWQSVAALNPWESYQAYKLFEIHEWFCEAVDYEKTGLFSTMHIREHGHAVMVEHQTHRRKESK